MKVFLIGLGSVLVLGLGAYFVMMSGTNTVPSKPAHVITAATSTIQESTDAYSIKIDYPQFGITSIDTQIKQRIDGAVSEFKTFSQSPPGAEIPKNEFVGTFENAYVGPDVISVELILMQYTGGAHPMTIFSGVNFDRATGKVLLLNDALTLIGKTVTDISAESTTQLKAKLADGFFPEGVTTNPENFSSFVISKDAVTFIFQEYQVAAYAAGPQRIVFKRIK
jgi:hypothetical protein